MDISFADACAIAAAILFLLWTLGVFDDDDEQDRKKDKKK